MNDEIIIDVGIDCTRTALLEDGELAEIYIERPNQQAIVGNIYMGKIKSILKGMQAAFIDIGTEKNAFLFLGYKMEETRRNAVSSSNSNRGGGGGGSGGGRDVGNVEISGTGGTGSTSDSSSVAAGSGSSHAVSSSNSHAGSGVSGGLNNNSDTDVVHGSGGSSSDDYDDMPSDINRRTFDPGSLREGGQIMVQVRKESYGTKGPRVSTDITLPGRYTVLLPEIEYAGVSRRIEKGEERDRLKKIIAAYKPAGMGVIARTAAEGINIREIARDIRFLAGIWKKIKKGIKSGPVPRCLYKDLDLAGRTVRDMFTSKIGKLAVNDKETYTRLFDMVRAVSPGLKKNIEYYNKEQDIFDYYNIEPAITKALGRKVRLKSGGYIVIDHTEALTVIDVNTGQYTGRYNLEDTVLKINIEATAEIVRQLRLRDIGGIIIIDYIDMSYPRHQRMVINELKSALKKDRTRSGVLGLTGLGLVEMTREKKRQTLDSALNAVCPTCEGTGKLISPGTVIRQIEKQVASAGPVRRLRRRNGIKIEVNPNVMAYIRKNTPDLRQKLEEKYKRDVELSESDCLKYKEIKVTLR